MPALFDRRWLSAPLTPVPKRLSVLGRLAVAGLFSILVAFDAGAEQYQSGIEWEEPPVVTPGAAPGAPPSDAVILFDGSDASAWRGGENWTVENGELVVGEGMIFSKRHFRDCQVHVEWASPASAKGSGQGRGNSGVFFHRFLDNEGYEVQILDSYRNKTYFDGQAAAIYKQSPPSVNAMRPPGEWNTYDLFWTAPRFDLDGKLESPACVTVVHNGVLVQNHHELLGDTYFHTKPTYRFDGEYGPIALQDHGKPVRFRNIWARDLRPVQGRQVHEPYFGPRRKKGEKKGE